MLTVYHELDRHMDSEGRRRVLEDLSSWRVGGVSRAFYPFDLAGTSRRPRRGSLPFPWRRRQSGTNTGSHRDIRVAAPSEVKNDLSGVTKKPNDFARFSE